MTDVRIVVTNTSPTGGTFLTPVWFGVHDDNLDLFDVGASAERPLEAIAEDGDFAPVAAALVAADADAQGGAVLGAAGPIATGETTSTTVTVDGQETPYITLAAMILPSNDAFIGTDDAVRLFDDYGNFLGAQTLTFDGGDVYDAGTEVNTELDAAFINQSANNTGVDEGGIIRLHPGFNGSAGNPVGEGDQIILGGTNAFGAPIDEVAADFTLPGAQIATIHINEVNVEEGSDRRDFLKGSRADDIFAGNGGRDILLGRSGWDELDGGEGRDFVVGGRGNDIVRGGTGNDILKAGKGDDLLSGDEGRDLLILGRGADTIVLADGDGRDKAFRFDAKEDRLLLDIAGVDNFDDVLDAAKGRGNSTLLDFGDAGITLVGVDLDDLTADVFGFA